MILIYGTFSGFNGVSELATIVASSCLELKSQAFTCWYLDLGLPVGVPLGPWIPGSVFFAPPAAKLDTSEVCPLATVARWT